MRSAAVFSPFAAAERSYNLTEEVDSTEIRVTKGAPNAMGYGDAGASYVRKALKAFIARSGSPRDDIDMHNFTLRQRGRMLYMASPIATSAIRTTCTNVVGIGLKLKSQVNREVLNMTPEQAKVWQKSVEAEWEMWSEKKECCDATGMCNFAGQQQLALASALTSGDCFALLPRVKPTPISPYSLRVRLVEADLVSTPDTAGVMPGTVTEAEAKNGNYIYDGVEVNRETSAVTAYHICNRYPFELSHIGKPRAWVRVEAYGKMTGLPNVLHIVDPERIGQYRGVTFLAPIIEQLLQIRRYTESELMAALVQSFFTAWIETESDPSLFPTNEVGSDEPEVSRDPNEYEMGAGQVIHLRPGEKVNFGNPNIPTNGFDSFVKSVATQIGAALEIPRDVLLKEFNSSYSASRGALLEAYRFFVKKRSWLVSSLCQPVYEVWLAEAVARGRISAPGFFADPRIRAAYCKAQWVGPAQSQIDPGKEVKAAILAVHEGFKTHEQATVEMGGGDWENNIEQLTREMELLGEAQGGSAANMPEDPDVDDGTDEGQNGQEGDAE